MAKMDDDGPIVANQSPLRLNNAFMIQKYRLHSFPPGLKYRSAELADEWRKLVQTDIDYTLMARVALRYLHSPTSSAPTERVWSTATNTAVKARRRMAGPNTSKLIMVGCNKDRVDQDFVEAFTRQ
jgi:hypothetical protein